jgi:hypothetical protein
MRLWSSLRPLRLLRSLRLLRILKPGYHSECKVQAIFGFFEATEAVEVIEACDVTTSGEVIEPTEVFRTTCSLEIDKLMARIT